ncbi:MAG: 6-bladed beta-propeller [Bacteroidaceae bacterium]|nr:6-bladed beta-propeller [Bacteroidaceae bacterium]
MRTKIIIIAILGFLYSCTHQANNPIGLDNSPVVAERIVTSQGDTVVVCNMKLMTDTIDFPMSLLFSEFELVKLEDKEEALIGNETQTFVSPSYVGIYSFYTGYKLFNKKGDFITNISQKGQGPNEYPIAIMGSYIDEENDKVYLIVPFSNAFLAFDLQGNPQNHIPVANGSINNASIRFDTSKQHLYVTHLAFSEDDASNEQLCYWEQDLQGNMIKKLKAGHLAARPDFSNELNSHMNTAAIDYAVGYCYDERVDSLYHYNHIKNRMEPVFTTNLDCISNYHAFIELPDYYCIFGNSYFGEGWRGYALIDKHSLKGSYVRFKLDMLGNIDIPQSNIIDHEYYKTCIHPYVLQEQWMKKGDIKGLPEGISRFVKYLQTHDCEEMNNVVLIGKLKQSKDEGFTLKDMEFKE